MNGGEAKTWPLATVHETRVLKAIYDKTGLYFGRIGGIKTDDPVIAERVLPILAEWHHLMPDSGHKCDISSRFGNPSGRAYLEQVLQWWKAEEEEPFKGFLTQTVAHLTDVTTANRVWQAYGEVPRDAFSVFILRKLAGVHSTSQAARDEAFKMLLDGPPGFGPLEIISRIKDTRIKRWFYAHADDPNPGVKQLATRVIKRGKPLPLRIETSEEGPDRSVELFSAEGNLRDIEEYFQMAERNGNFKIPSWVRKLDFLDQVERDEWIFTDIHQKGKAFRLWFRLEDLDIIEFVLSPGEHEDDSRVSS